MSQPDDRPGHEPTDSEKDLAPHERPDVGLIGDEDLPEDLQPTDDNPLAKDPGEEGTDEGGTPPGNVEGMPDMGDPGAPA